MAAVVGDEEGAVATSCSRSHDRMAAMVATMMIMARLRDDAPGEPLRTRPLERQMDSFVKSTNQVSMAFLSVERNWPRMHLPRQAGNSEPLPIFSPARVFICWVAGLQH